MAPRIAESLDVLRSQVNAAYPNRSKTDDGWIGDIRHQATHSDHNPNAAGVVCALDLTHDPRHGFDSYAFADYLRRHPDKRARYIISNRRIAGDEGYVAENGGKLWTWAYYGGLNAHDQHVHISVDQNAATYDLTDPWNIGPLISADPKAPAKDELPVLAIGSTGAMVERVQSMLGLPVDSQFGKTTEFAVKAFQAAHSLVADGIVGGYTWRALLTPTSAGGPFTSGKGSWYSQYDGKYRWRDSGDAPGSSALGVPDNAQGVSFYNSATLGKWFEVEAPNGVRSIEQQTDIGPNPNTGRGIDISAAAAERFGYRPGNFPTDRIFKWRLIGVPPALAGLSPRAQAIQYAASRVTT
jgi:peptidoglycan hydrolase-like protein with peptidoglycan-binding domain